MWSGYELRSSFSPRSTERFQPAGRKPKTTGSEGYPKGFTKSAPLHGRRLRKTFGESQGNNPRRTFENQIEGTILDLAKVRAQRLEHRGAVGVARPALLVLVKRYARHIGDCRRRLPEQKGQAAKVIRRLVT